MSNPAKRKGTKWETDIVAYLRENGFPEARRVVQEGRYDTGDIHVQDFVIQAKAYNDILAGLRDGTKGAAAQREVSGLEFGVAVVKRPGKNVREGYVAMTLEEFLRLLKGYYER